MILKKSPQKKARSHTLKGDKLLKNGKTQAALDEYRKALELDPTQKDIYSKLLNAHEGLDEEWKIDDFAENLSCLMKQQELDHPIIKQTHAKLSPEWKKAYGTILEIINCEDENERGLKIDELIIMGEIATRAAVGLLMELKEKSKGEG